MLCFVTFSRNFLLHFEITLQVLKHKKNDRKKAI